MSPLDLSLSPFKSPFVISGLLVGLSSFCFGLFVLMKAPKKRLNQLWFLFSLTVAVWGFSALWGGSEKDPHLALLKWRTVGALGITWIPVLYFHFICRFLKIKRPKVLLASYLAGAVFAYLNTTPAIFRETRYLWNEVHWPVAGALHPIFYLWWTALIFYSHWELWLQYKKCKGIRKCQIRLFFLASTIGYFCGGLEYLPDYKIDLYPWSNFGVALYPYIMTYAILQYRLFDISLIIRRSILYSILCAFLITGYFGLVYAAQQLFQMTLLQHHILALGLTAVTTLGLGLLVFLAEPKRRLNQVFGLYSLAISWWAFTEILLVCAKDQAMANSISYMKWPGVIFIAPTFTHTVLLSIRQRARGTKSVLLAAYGGSVLFLLFHLFTPLVTASPRPVGYVPFFDNCTTLGTLIPLTFFVLVNLALWKLWHAYRGATGQRRTQLKYLFWASMIGYLGGSPDWFFTRGFYVPFISPFGIYGVPLYSIATTYAVLHHRLFDVNVVIRKSLVYSLLVTILTVGYFGLAFGIERLFQMTFGYRSLWLSFAAFATMALLFQPLKIGIQRLVDWLLFRAPHEEMVKRMERLEHEVLQAEKLKAVSTLAAGMAHEIKNPLTAILTFAEFIPEKRSDPEFLDKLHHVLTEEARRIKGIVEELLDFAKPKTPQFKPVDLRLLIGSTVDLLSTELLKRQIAWTVSCEHNGANVHADPDQIRQVLINLIQNAADAMPTGGTLTLITQAPDGYLEMLVSDTGQGIPKDLLPRIFDPFVTTKSQGTGLGLAVVHSIVQAHHGTIHVDSHPGRGTTFTVRLPL